MTPTKKPHSQIRKNQLEQEMSPEKFEALIQKVIKVLNMDDAPSSYSSPTKKVPNYFSAHVRMSNISLLDVETKSASENLNSNSMNFPDFSSNSKISHLSANTLNPYVKILRNPNIERKSLEIQTQKTSSESVTGQNQNVRPIPESVTGQNQKARPIPESVTGQNQKVRPKTRLERQKLEEQKLEREKNRSRILDQQVNPTNLKRSAGLTGFEIEPKRSRNRQSGKRNCPCCQSNRKSKDTNPTDHSSSPSSTLSVETTDLETSERKLGSSAVAIIRESSYCFICSHQVQ